MEFVKLKTTYYNDLAIRAAGEAAEVLFTRGLAFSGEQETDGFIPEWAPSALTPSKTTARITALVREGLWVQVEGGWQIAGWEKHQALKSEVEHKRELARQRQARKRASEKSSRGTSRVTDSVTHAGSSRTEVEIEIDAAAAASRETAQPAAAAPTTIQGGQASPADASGPIAILRAKLDAHRLTVRWDKLTAEQVADIEQLIAVHGDAPLVRSAVQSFRPDSPPVFAQAWLATWRALPTTGRLAAVPNAEPCPEPGHQGTTDRCTDCIVESKVDEGYRSHSRLSRSPR